MPPRLPGGAIAQGSIFSISGTRLGPAAPGQANSFPIGTTLAGTSITVTQGATTVNALPLYVSASEVTAIMPSNAPLGAASLRVQNTANGQSNPMTVIVSQSAFGIFTGSGTGFGPGILQNVISPANQTFNSPINAAIPGQTITLWGTGLGPVAADNVAPAAGNLSTKVEVFVGDVAANVLSSGRTPCCAGIDQIAFQVPNNAPQGCWVPVAVRTAGKTVSNFVTMAITPDGSFCLDPLLPWGLAGKYGGVVALRVATHEDIGTRSAIDVVGDYAASIAYQMPSSEEPFHPMLSFPPGGACTVYSVKGDLLRGDTLPGAVPGGGKALSFSPMVTLAGPAGMKMLQNIIPTSPLRYLGGSITGNLFNNTLFLQPGNYSASGLPGGDVGAFSTSAVMPAPLTWTNRDQLVLIDRTQPLNVAWTGGSGTQVAIVGFGVDLPTDTTTAFGCLAPLGATSFSVPPLILSNVPPTRPNPLQSKSVIYLGNAPSVTSTAKLFANSLDSGLLILQSATGKTVFFQ